jgi:hypothetical protein
MDDAIVCFFACRRSLSLFAKSELYNISRAVAIVEPSQKLNTISSQRISVGLLLNFSFPAGSISSRV